jgi:hypothetical protein
LRQAAETLCDEKTSHTNRVFTGYAAAVGDGRSRLAGRGFFMPHKPITFAIFFKSLSLFTMHCNKAKGM